MPRHKAGNAAVQASARNSRKQQDGEHAPSRNFSAPTLGEPLIEACCVKADAVETSILQTISSIRKSLGSICNIDDFEEEDEDEGDQILTQLSKGKLTEIAVDHVPQSEREQWKEFFDRLDTDKSGKVGIMELKSLLEKERKKQVPKAEMERMMKDYDFNQDGRLDFEEFLVLRAVTGEKKQDNFRAKAQQLLKSSTTRDLGEKDRIQTVHLQGVPKAWVKKYIRKELNETSACLQLPWAAMIFIFFGVSVMMHFRFEVLFALDEAITFDIEENANFAFSGNVPFENGRMGHKTLYDVNTIADFWSWMSMGLVPIFWPQSWDVNEARANVQIACSDAKSALQGFGWPSQKLKFTPSPAAIGAACPEPQGVQWSQESTRFFGQRKLDGHFLIHSSIVGGARIRQERVSAEECGVTNEDGKIHAGLCNPDTFSYWLQPDFNQLLEFSKKYEDRSGGETVYLLSRQQQSDVRAAVRALEDRQWFSPETAKIEILFTVYQPRNNILSATYIYFILNEAGHIHKSLDPFSFNLNPYGNAGLYVIDIIWLLLTLKLFVEESWEIVKHIKQLGLRQGLWQYIDVPNFVDWVSILYAFVMVVLWVLYCQELREIRDLLTQGNPELVGTWADASVREQFYETVHQTTKDTVQMRVTLAIYPFVIISRFFKAFSAQARLAMVTSTLSQAAVDIFHFAIVFGCIFLLYTLSAVILWGGEKEYFATFTRAFNSVFRLMLGDFDWEEMHDVGRPQALLWFWTFTWLVNFIMLNMLLAIIMDIYGDVKAFSTNAPTLWHQAHHIWNRWKLVRQGKAMRLSEVLTLLDPTDLVEDDEDEEDSELVLVETLTDEYNLKIRQAEIILVEACKMMDSYAKKQNLGGMSEHRQMSRIETKVVQIHRFLQAYARRSKHLEKSSRGPPPQNEQATRELEL